MGHNGNKSQRHRFSNRPYPVDSEAPSNLLKERNAPYSSGRGAQLQPLNPFQSSHTFYDEDAIGFDQGIIDPKTTFSREAAKSIINPIESEDIPAPYSLNPYQGCEHGCAYCYARPTHQYWGFSSGLDFESKIIVKENAAALLEIALRKPSWKVGPILLSGNTDCYQPIERKEMITHSLLKILLKFRNPVSIITKNALIARDIPLLQEMAQMRLAQVSISLTAGSDTLRRELEPRSSTIRARLDTIERLSKAGIPVNAMLAPIIPGLNSDDMADVLRQASDAGAISAGYSIIRLPGPVEQIFRNWLTYAYPDRAAKVMGLIQGMHSGQYSSSQFGVRMKGNGPIAASIHDFFHLLKGRYFGQGCMPAFDLTLFQVPDITGQLSLF